MTVVLAQLLLLMVETCKQGQLSESEIMIGLLILVMDRKTKICLADIESEFVNDDDY